MTSDKHLRCSFCGKSKESVKKFISGPNVYICNECISLCNEILAEEEEHYGWASDMRSQLLMSIAVGGTDDADGTSAAATDVTRDELYAQAQELDIPGRSQMTKDELRAAVDEHGGADR